MQRTHVCTSREQLYSITGLNHSIIVLAVASYIYTPSGVESTSEASIRSAELCAAREKKKELYGTQNTQSCCPPKAYYRIIA